MAGRLTNHTVKHLQFSTGEAAGTRACQIPRRQQKLGVVKHGSNGLGLHFQQGGWSRITEFDWHITGLVGMASLTLK